MSTVALAPRSVLADRFVIRSLATDTALVVGGAALVGLLAQASVPLWPVPVTGQTLGVLLVGGSLGMRRGATSMLVYMLAGLAGMPWFSDQGSGPPMLVAPSFGYIIGFVFMAALVGWLAERHWDRRPLLSAAGFALASLVPFLFGLPYLAAVLDLTDVQTVLALGFYPFIVGGLVKWAIAAAVFPLAWRGVRALDSRRD